MPTFKAMSDLVADAEDLLSKLGDSTEPKVKEIKGRLEASLEDMRQQLKGQMRSGAESLEDVTDSLEEVAQTVVKVVRENPWIALAAGTAVAVALMYVAFTGRDRD
jgi:ElaB/YqjD/DUF883 family membrane-anchored ribosome-binding protein